MSVIKFGAWQDLSGNEVANSSEPVGDVGLVFIKSQTIDTNVSSVTVTDAFSSTFDNYRITLNGGVGNLPQTINMVLGASTSSYYMALQYTYYSTGAYTTLLTNNGSIWTAIGEATPNNNTINCDLQNPNLAKFTTISGFYAGSVGGFISGYHGVATAYTDFTISVAGTLTGGTIRVYGYRN